MPSPALATARRYHDAWTTGDFPTAVSLLADDLIVEVPVNEYPTKESFAGALRSFGSAATRVELLAGTEGEQEALLLYDMEVPGLGALRVAEHFTVADGRIVRLRQVHDTHALRATGFVKAGPHD
jgi:ketosteroid isomerase-like protein